MEKLYGVDLRVICKTADVLKKLEENRIKHAEIVKEAKLGYLDKASKCLLEKLNEIKSGRVSPLTFNLMVPKSHLSAYDTVIKMLQMHQQPTIELSANEVRQFIEDKWEWTNLFMGSSSLYSQTAQKEYALLAQESFDL